MKRLSAFALTFFVLLGANPAGATTHNLVTPRVFQMVMKIHLCEAKALGWHVNGPKYFGGLGWLYSTWLTYRSAWMPTNMADATPQEQALAMVHFVNRTLHYWPHQGYPAYCGPGY